MASESATLGGGCFWCTEAVYQELNGVQRIEPGYSGGQRANPTYEQVCTGRTGHAEVVRIHFDPAVLSYRTLLEIFFTIHDPTTLNRQGNDIGPQYRSVIYYHDDTQQQIAQQVKAEMANVWDAPLVTEISPLTAFYPAESEHVDYYRRNPRQGYCSYVIAPKVAKFRKLYADRLRPVGAQGSH